MRNAIDWLLYVGFARRRCPSFKNMANPPHTLSIEPGEHRPLKVVHRRSRIMFEQRIRHAERRIGETRLIACVMECKCICVIDDVGIVACLASCLLQQRHGCVKVAVLQRRERFLIAHARIVD